MLKIAWTEEYVLPLPPKHRFPMEKYALLPEQLLYEGTVNQENFFQPGSLTDQRILSIHTSEYWEKLNSLNLSKQEVRAAGFPLTRALVDREKRIGQGTVDCASFALDYGIAMNIAGGTHHAFSYKGEGFCLLNDIGMASRQLLDQKLVKQILVVDLDVHQGNGTAEIFNEDASVFTFSMHGAKNYPLRKEVSDLDIGLPDFTEDEPYLKLLKDNLPPLIEKLQPDFIFYLAGVDTLATDKLGRLGMSPQGCKERDRFVLQLCKDNDIPVVVLMGGGYSPKVTDIVEAHANTYRLAQEIYF